MGANPNNHKQKISALLSGFFVWSIVFVWARGGTGIRVRLRSVSRKSWEFESPRAHLKIFCRKKYSI